MSYPSSNLPVTGEPRVDAQAAYDAQTQRLANAWKATSW